MFDIQLRSLKDGLFDPACAHIPGFISPTQVTIAAFFSGLLSGYFATKQQVTLSLVFWFLNRTLDCLDGALARYRYSILPMTIAHGSDGTSTTWRAVAVLEATFHVNNFILFYIAAVAEKLQAKGGKSLTELTSVMMRPALIEGMESALLFTIMLAFPSGIQAISWTMASLVCIGIAQRTFWIIDALS